MFMLIPFVLWKANSTAVIQANNRHAATVSD